MVVSWALNTSDTRTDYGSRNVPVTIFALFGIWNRVRVDLDMCVVWLPCLYAHGGLNQTAILPESWLKSRISLVIIHTRAKHIQRLGLPIGNTRYHSSHVEAGDGKGEHCFRA